MDTLTKFIVGGMTILIPLLLVIWYAKRVSNPRSDGDASSDHKEKKGHDAHHDGHGHSNSDGNPLGKWVRWILWFCLIAWLSSQIIGIIKDRPAPPPPIVDETRRLWHAEIILKSGERKELSDHDARILQNNSAGFKALYPLDGGTCIIYQSFIPYGEGSWECVKYGKVVAKGGITISPNQVGNTIIGQMWDIDPIKDPGPYIVQFKALNRWWDGR